MISLMYTKEYRVPSSFYMLNFRQCHVTAQRFYVAEREGFEPSVPFQGHTLSKRAH